MVVVVNVTTPTAAERAEWRESHLSRPDLPEFCSECLDLWPCPTIRMLDALDAAEADVARLREDLASARTTLRHVAEDATIADRFLAGDAVATEVALPSIEDVAGRFDLGYDPEATTRTT